MTNQIHTRKTARTMKYSDRDENNEQTTTERKAQSRHTHKKGVSYCSNNKSFSTVTHFRF